MANGVWPFRVTVGNEDPVVGAGLLQFTSLDNSQVITFGVVDFCVFSPFIFHVNIMKNVL